MIKLYIYTTFLKTKTLSHLFLVPALLSSIPLNVNIYYVKLHKLADWKPSLQIRDVVVHELDERRRHVLHHMLEYKGRHDRYGHDLSAFVNDCG